MLDALIASCTPVAGVDASPLLLHGVYDMPRGIGVDEGTLWGDYYFLEALTRRTLPQWRSYWWVAGEER
jgi:unsaturated chondroitin disaccharide hydrolase